MSKTDFIDLLKYPFSHRARRRVRDRRKQIKLIMTLVVKNEENIIEQNIRFHHAMGVDGFIVTTHNCTDHTVSILNKLKKEGFVIETIKKTTPDHKHKIWVNEMVHFAKNKMGADWVINADADEFYYSQSLDLKKSIINEMSGKTNVLWVDSLFLFPDDRPDFLNCPYFVVNPFTKFKAEELKIDVDPLFEDFIGSQGCTKVIHKTHGFKSVVDGNHDVYMRNRVKHQSADIRLYHFHIRNYYGWEEKVKRWQKSIFLLPEDQGIHMKNMVRLYEAGKLRKEYDKKYGKKMRDFLIENGVVSRDLSVSDFMRNRGIKC